MTASRAAWRGLAIALGFGFVALNWGLDRRVIYPFTSDSAAYVDMARSFSEDGTLTAVPYGVEPTEVVRLPVRTWPPLYSMVVAGVHATGVPVATAAAWTNRVAAALIPLLLVVLFEGLAAPGALLLVGVLVLSAPGVRTNHFMALSDCLCLFFTLLAVGLALRRKSLKAVFASGLAAGCAYAVRNPGLAVLLAVPAWFALLAFVSAEPRRAQLRTAMVWGIGALCIVTPLLVYNATVFGSFQPYSAQAPTVGLWVNVTALTGAIVGELAGAYFADKVSSHLWSLGIAGVVGALSLLAIARTLRAAPDARVRATTLLLIFAACGGGLVIAASIRFGGVETGSHRQAMQYTWALLLLCGILFDRQATGRAWPVVCAAALLLLVFRTYDFAKRVTLRAHVPDHTLAIVADTQLRSAIRSRNAAGAFWVSNTPWVFRVEDDVSVRQLIGCNFERDQLRELEALHSRGRTVLFVLTNGGSDAECLDRWSVLMEQSSFRRVTTFHAGIIVSAGAPDAHALRPDGLP